MDVVIGIIVGLVLLTVIVVIHELGHAIAARRNGVVVEEFGIGFPPRAKAWRVKKSFLGKNVEYSLNWLPIGGFVKMQGEHDADSKKGDYGTATFWQKTKILLAGVVMNWLTAIVLLTILSLFGIPRLIDNQFTVASDTTSTKSPVELAYVSEDSPAQKSGLQMHDNVIEFAGESVETPEALYELTKKNAGTVVDVRYTRDNDSTIRSVSVTLRDETEGSEKGYFGAVPLQRETLRATWSAPIVGVGLTWQLTDLTMRSLGELVGNVASGVIGKFSGDEQARKQADQKIETASQSVAGPVGLIGMIMPGIIQAGVQFVVFLVAIISVSLAVFNVLPIPALDGGRWFVTALYRLLGKELTPEREEKIHGTGMIVLLGIFVLITIADIGKFF